jgi:hypothetical protein
MALRFLSVKSFSDRYAVSRSFAYELISAGKLLAIKIGGKTVIDYASAETWADGLPALSGPPARLKAANAARGLA